LLIRKMGMQWFDNVFLKRLGPVTIVALLLTLVLLFSFQGEVILNNPLHIALIAIPLIIQTFFIFTIAYTAAKFLKLPHRIAAPASMIGASNFFELAVAAAIGLFGVTSGAALATVVGVLVEVPVMLMLVRIANNTRKHFPRKCRVGQYYRRRIKLKFKIDADALAYLMEHHNGELMLRTSPRHGCCGGTVMLPVLEPGAPPRQ
jgi:ACR3 family arsenite efflux pump ArsB